MAAGACEGAAGEPGRGRGREWGNETTDGFLSVASEVNYLEETVDVYLGGVTE